MLHTAYGNPVTYRSLCGNISCRKHMEKPDMSPYAAGKFHRVKDRIVRSLGIIRRADDF